MTRRHWVCRLLLRKYELADTPQHRNHPIRCPRCGNEPRKVTT